MTRLRPHLLLLFLGACGVEDPDAMLAMYDTYGSTGATSSITAAETGTSTSTSAGTTDGPEKG